MASSSLFRAIAFAGAVGMLAACGGGGSLGDSSSDGGGASDVIKVGLLVPQTGVYASLGEEMTRAADLFIKEHQNKIGGKTVELVIADTAGDPEAGKSKARQLALNDKVDVIIGVVASPVAATVAQEATADKIPFVIANAGADKLTGLDASPYVWRTSQSNYGHGYAAGVYAAKHVSKTGAAYMGADYSAGTETRAGFVAGYKANGGGELVASILTPFGKTQNYQPFLSRIPADAKFVYAFYAGGEAITFQKNYESFGYKDKFPLIGAQNLTDEDIVATLGDSGVGVTTVGIYAPALDNHVNQTFVKNWAADSDKRPSIIAVTTTDAFTFVDAAASKAGDVSPESLTKAFPEVGQIDSARGSFTIDPKTHNPVQNYYARTLEKQGSDYVNSVVATIPNISGVPDS